MEENGRKVRLNQAYEHLRNNGLAHTQQDVAEKMGKGKSRISEAFSGKASDKFFEAFNKSYGNIFNMDWLINGVGSMLCCEGSGDVNAMFNAPGDNNTNTQIVNGDCAVLQKENEMLKERIAKQDEEIAFLRGLVKK